MTTGPHPHPAPGASPEPDAGRDPAAILEERLGFRIADPALALEALTHKSFVNEQRGEALADNERLEFLGDAVIDLAVSHRLMERFPTAREGDLSKLRAALVDESGLARLARGLGLGALLRLGRGEELTGGRDKASLLADALEAVVAAVYLSGGLGPVLDLLDRLLAEAFERAAAGRLDRDYKTQLQEVTQSRFRSSPRYRVVAATGPDHEKVFEVELLLRGQAMGKGSGRSKKDAEQAAARMALEALASGAVPADEGEHGAPPPAPAAGPAPAAAERAAPGAAQVPPRRARAPRRPRPASPTAPRAKSRSPRGRAARRKAPGTRAPGRGKKR